MHGFVFTSASSTAPERYWQSTSAPHIAMQKTRLGPYGGCGVYSPTNIRPLVLVVLLLGFAAVLAQAQSSNHEAGDANGQLTGRSSQGSRYQGSHTHQGSHHGQTGYQGSHSNQGSNHGSSQGSFQGSHQGSNHGSHQSGQHSSHHGSSNQQGHYQGGQQGHYQGGQQGHYQGGQQGHQGSSHGFNNQGNRG